MGFLVSRVNRLRFCLSLWGVVVLLLATACAGTDSEVVTSTTDQPATTGAPDPSEEPWLAELPVEARVSTGGAEPRTPAYWAVWNSCAPNNRSEEAAANGGRQAGWILMDDLLTNPGVSVGDFVIESCEEGLNMLEALETSSAPRSSEWVYLLAAHVLSAELNLNVGAETCPAAEEAVIAGHFALSSAQFVGSGDYVITATPDIVDSAEAITRLLEAYGRGVLCR